MTGIEGEVIDLTIAGEPTITYEKSDVLDSQTESDSLPSNESNNVDDESLEE